MKRLIVLIIFYSSLTFAQEVLDKIVAVVDDEYILQSELDFQTQLTAYQRRLNPNDPTLKKNVLNSMIEEKLILAQAQIDSVNVSEEEVSRQLEYQIDMFIEQYGSKENFEKVYNRPLEKIKRELRDEVKNNLLIQKVQGQRFASMEISRFEVEEFFNSYKDSLGKVPEEVKLSQIFISPKISELDRERVKNRVEKIIDSIKSGIDFGELAKRNSEDPATAKDGGDLGFVKRGLFFKEFEESAFTLNEGEVSGPVETPLGFHIIKLLERRGESVRVHHILLKVQLSQEMDETVKSKLKIIADSIRNGVGSFADFARKYSEDKASAQFGGEMGTLQVTELETDMRNVVAKLSEGEISEPRKLTLAQNQYGYQVILLEKRIPEHFPNLDQDFEKLSQIALFNKKQKIYTDWIEQLKKLVYWEVRI
ncbi:MAG: parvulin peptidyl-prolyl isomerase [Ignavibacteria bacterium]|nr:parvulin peptidyl-prolyl isomerase [Ignavibacteria bacterium]